MLVDFLQEKMIVFEVDKICIYAPSAWATRRLKIIQISTLLRSTRTEAQFAALMSIVAREIWQAHVRDAQSRGEEI